MRHPKVMNDLQFWKLTLLGWRLWLLEYVTTLAASTLITLFSEMLKFLENIIFKEKKYLWRNLQNLCEFDFIFGMETSNLINYSMDMCWSWPSTTIFLCLAATRCEVGFTIFLKPLDWVHVLHENCKARKRNWHIFSSCNMMFRYTKGKKKKWGLSVEHLIMK